MSNASSSCNDDGNCDDDGLSLLSSHSSSSHHSRQSTQSNPLVYKAPSRSRDPSSRNNQSLPTSSFVSKSRGRAPSIDADDIILIKQHISYLPHAYHCIIDSTSPVYCSSKVVTSDPSQITVSSEANTLNSSSSSSCDTKSDTITLSNVTLLSLRHNFPSVVAMSIVALPSSILFIIYVIYRFKSIGAIAAVLLLLIFFIVAVVFAYTCYYSYKSYALKKKGLWKYGLFLLNNAYNNNILLLRVTENEISLIPKNRIHVIKIVKQIKLCEELIGRGNHDMVRLVFADEDECGTLRNTASSRSPASAVATNDTDDASAFHQPTSSPFQYLDIDCRKFEATAKQMLSILKSWIVQNSNSSSNRVNDV